MNLEHTPGLPDAVGEACRRVRVDSRIVALMEQVAEERVLTAGTDTPSYVGVRPASGQIAVYLNPGNLDLRLDTERARLISRQREWPLTEANDRTGTLRVLATQLIGDVPGVVRELVHEALDRGESGPDFRNDGGGGRSATRPVDICEVHGVEKLGGVCDLCA